MFFPHFTDIVTAHCLQLVSWFAQILTLHLSPIRLKDLLVISSYCPPNTINLLHFSKATLPPLFTHRLQSLNHTQTLCHRPRIVLFFKQFLISLLLSQAVDKTLKYPNKLNLSCRANQPFLSISQQRKRSLDFQKDPRHWCKLHKTNNPKFKRLNLYRILLTKHT